MLKKKWGRNWNCDEILQLFHKNYDKISQKMLDDIKTTF